MCVKWTLSSSLHLFSFKGHYFLFISSFLSFFLLFIFLIPLFFPFFYYSSPSPSLFHPVSCFPHQGGREADIKYTDSYILGTAKTLLKEKRFSGIKREPYSLKPHMWLSSNSCVGIANFITRIYMDPLFSQQFFNGYNMNNKIVKTVFVQRSSKK